MLRIISLGLGMQSTALYLMSSMGILPTADYAIFADTGKEGIGTYTNLDFLTSWKQKNNGIPIVVLKSKNLYTDLLSPDYRQRPVSIPGFRLGPTGNVGMLRRQCTSEYKIAVIDDYIRDSIYGLPKWSRRPVTSLWHGITKDEQERMSIPQQAWKINTYPFTGYYCNHQGITEKLEWAKPMLRQDVIRWYVLNQLPIPPKSACVFCPYQTDDSWARKKHYQPEDFAAAVQVDRAIRDSTRGGIHYPVFLHRSCKPLDEVDFDRSQQPGNDECSGHCHV